MGSKKVGETVKIALPALLLFMKQIVLAGTIIGGGGGNIPTEEICHPSEIEFHVKQKNLDLRLALMLEHSFFEPGPFPDGYSSPISGPTDTLIYGGKKTILDLIEKTPIEIRETEPCLDAAGNAVDASVFSSKEGGICLSAFRIAPKVSTKRIRAETLALVAHEFAHLLGVEDELEATRFQERILRRLSFVENDGASWFVEKSRSTAARGHLLLVRLLTAIDEKSNLEMAVNATELRGLLPNSNLSYYISPVQMTSFSVFDRFQRAQQWYREIQIRNLSMAVLSMLDPDGPRQEEYFKKFDGNKSVSAAQFACSCTPKAGEDFLLGEYIHKPVFRIENLNQLREKIIEQKIDFKELESKIESLKKY